MAELLRTPVPYRTTAYALPSVPLHYAQATPMADGARIATFVYGPSGVELDELLGAHPVLALHGNGGTHATFTKVIERLVAAGKGVIAFDARAQGRSTRGSLPLTYEQLADDAIVVLRALGASRVHVVGHSDGGIVALLLARDHGDEVLSIVAGGANLTPESSTTPPGTPPARLPPTARGPHSWTALPCPMPSTPRCCPQRRMRGSRQSCCS